MILLIKTMCSIGWNLIYNQQNRLGRHGACVLNTYINRLKLELYIQNFTKHFNHTKTMKNKENKRP